MRYDALLLKGMLRTMMRRPGDAIAIAFLIVFVTATYRARITDFVRGAPMQEAIAAVLVPCVAFYVGIYAAQRRLAFHRDRSPFAPEALHGLVAALYLAIGAALSLVAAVGLMMPVVTTARINGFEFCAGALAGMALALMRPFVRLPRPGSRFACASAHSKNCSYADLLHRLSWAPLASPTAIQGFALVAMYGLLVVGIGAAIGPMPVLAHAVLFASALPLLVLLLRVDTQVVRYMALSGMSLQQMMGKEAMFCASYTAAALVAAPVASRPLMHVAVVCSLGLVLTLVRLWTTLHARIDGGRGARRMANLELSMLGLGLTIAPPIAAILAFVRLSNLGRRSKATTWTLE